MDTISALTNQGMCLLCNQQYGAALAKCEEALLIATGFQKLPAHPWAALWLQGQLQPASGVEMASNEAKNHENKENAVQKGQSKPHNDEGRNDAQKGSQERESNVKVPKNGISKLCNLVPKTLGRMASCNAHLKEYESAYRLYVEATEASMTLGMEAEANAFNGDATCMQDLLKQEKEHTLADSTGQSHKATALDYESTVVGG